MVVRSSPSTSRRMAGCSSPTLLACVLRFSVEVPGRNHIGRRLGQVDQADRQNGWGFVLQHHVRTLVFLLDNFHSYMVLAINQTTQQSYEAFKARAMCRSSSATGSATSVSTSTSIHKTIAARKHLFKHIGWLPKSFRFQGGKNGRDYLNLLFDFNVSTYLVLHQIHTFELPKNKTWYATGWEGP